MKKQFVTFVVVLVALAAISLPFESASARAPAAAVTGPNHVHSIAVMPHDPNELYVGMHYHLYQATGGGRQWRALSGMMMLSLALDPAHASTLYAVSLQDGPIKSTDGGRHWKSIGRGIPKGYVTGMAYNAKAHALLAYGVGVYRSTDGGARWVHALSSGSVANVAVSGDGMAYAATGNGVMLSKDGGKTWRSVKSVSGQPVLQVAAAGPYAYAATAATGLVVSHNNGTSWSPAPKAPFGIEFLGVAPTDPKEVFGEIGEKGFVASYNGGATWHSANTGIRDRNFTSSTVVVAPSSPKIVYTGSWGSDFYASHDAGHHWTLVKRLTR